MSVEIIACSMMEDEINEALKSTGVKVNPIWMERQLHRVPVLLKSEIQKQINSSDKDTILLAFGLCGTATEGLYSEKAKIVIPRFHDCIHILLSEKVGSTGNVNPRALYQTKGWFQGRFAFMNEYNRSAKKYGDKKTKYIYKSMLKNYKDIVLIDTKSYKIPSIKKEAQNMADTLELQLKIEEGTIRILKKMFLGDWDKEFIVLDPGEKIEINSFMVGGIDDFVSTPI